MKTYTPDEVMTKRLENDFSYHPPKEGQAGKYELIRAAGKDLAMHITGLTPPSREQSLALTHIEEAIFWANAAVARHEVIE